MKQCDLEGFFQRHQKTKNNTREDAPDDDEQEYIITIEFYEHSDGHTI